MRRNKKKQEKTAKEEQKQSKKQMKKKNQAKKRKKAKDFICSIIWHLPFLQLTLSRVSCLQMKNENKGYERNANSTMSDTLLNKHKCEHLKI